MHSHYMTNSFNEPSEACRPNSIGVYLAEDLSGLALTDMVWDYVLATPHWHVPFVRGIVLSDFSKVHLMNIHFHWKRELLSNLNGNFIDYYVFLILVKEDLSGLVFEFLELSLHVVLMSSLVVAYLGSKLFFIVLYLMILSS